MTPHEFNYLRQVLHERSGIALNEERREILEGRLRPMLKTFGFASVAELTRAMMRPDGEYLRGRMAQAVTVQESYFFRDKTPFNYFAETILPRLMEARAAPHAIRLWCAATATGQEPYSLAMLIAERAPKLDGWSLDLLATDFAEDALRKARKGLYSQFEVQRGLPVSLLIKYFQKAGTGWEINPDIRAMVQFREHNLLRDDGELGVFDVIFCRNVLIYFDDATKRQVLARLALHLAKDGYLVLGAAETTTGLSDAFTAVLEGQHGVFGLSPAALAARVPKGNGGTDAGPARPAFEVASDATPAFAYSCR